MARFQTHRPLDASPSPQGLGRRALLIGVVGVGAGLGLAACGPGVPMTASTSPPLDMERLNRAAGDIAARVQPGLLGAGLMNLESGEAWTFNGERAFPMQAAAYLPIAAAALAEVDAQRLSLGETMVVAETDLSPPPSPIAQAWPGRREYSLGELIDAALRQGDTTAADLVMRRIGGPGAVAAWLTAKKIDEVRVDRYQREMQPEMVGLTPFRPGWRGEFNYAAAVERVGAGAQRAALARYLADPRDTATPRGMLTLLQQLDSSQLISSPSTRLLMKVLQDNPGAPERLKAGLPNGAVLAHVAGSARTILGAAPALADVGVATLANKRSYALAVFLAGARLDAPAREAVFADLARAIVQSLS